jgi:hypothetical protein
MRRTLTPNHRMRRTLNSNSEGHAIANVGSPYARSEGKEDGAVPDELIKKKTCKKSRTISRRPSRLDTVVAHTLTPSPNP